MIFRVVVHFVDKAQIGALERPQGQFAAAFDSHWIPLENY
jgi:hypothetical protein